MENDAVPGLCFQYKPLQSTDSIRLLHLQPSKDITSQISISLSESPLQDALPYEALSYTWGDVQNQQQVTVLTKKVADGEAVGITTLSISAHCYSSLRRLRHESEERILWVDAICINQDDIQERNTQVAQMGNIYCHASRVIIDVGESTKTSEAAIDFISIYHHQTNTDDPERNNLFKNKLYDMIQGMHLRDIVREFYSRPWFSRVWVLQEAFLSQSAQLLCGTRLTDWSVFQPFRIWVDSRPAWETEHWHVFMPRQVPLVLAMNGAASKGQGRKKYTTGNDLLKLLCETRNCLASDQRDKVFSLLSMMDFPPEETTPGSGVPAPMADYNKTTAQVYTETAAWLLPRVGLSLLSCVHHSPDPSATTIPGLPSWVPDWSTRYLPEWMINNPSNPVYHPLQACGTTHYTTPSQTIQLLTNPLHSPTSTPTTFALTIRGIPIDTILTLTHKSPIRPERPTPPILTFLSHARTHRHSLPLPRAAPLPRAPRWKPKTAETRLHPPPWAAYEYGLPLQNPHLLSDNDVCDYMSFLCGSRQLALTGGRGYVGVVPDAAAEGDLVCLFFGGRVPFVLRSVESGDGEYYSLIGEAYVYWLMSGEGFEGIGEGGDAEVRDFVII